MRGILMTLVVLGVIAVLYFGFISMIGKAMKSNPEAEQSPQYDKMLQEQSLKAQDLRQQQRRLMQEREAMMRDMRNR